MDLMPPIMHFEHGNLVNLNGDLFSHPISDITKQTSAKCGWPKTENNHHYRQEILNYGQV